MSSCRSITWLGSRLPRILRPSMSWVRTFDLRGLFVEHVLFAIIVFLFFLTYVFVVRAQVAMVGCGRGRWAVPVRCAFDNDSPRCLKLNWHGAFNILWQCAWMVALLLIIFGYLIRIQDLYLNERHPLFLFGWLVWKITGRSTTGVSYKQDYEEKRASLRLDRIHNVHTRTGFRSYPYMLQGYDDSFSLVHSWHFVQLPICCFTSRSSPMERRPATLYNGQCW